MAGILSPIFVVLLLAGIVKSLGVIAPALGRNLGESFEVLDGVSAKDRIVLNPPDSLAEGDIVALAPTPAEAPGGAASGANVGGREALGAKGSP